MTAPQPPDPASLRAGRVHEATGPGRLAMALALAGRLSGPVLWIVEARLRETLAGHGVSAFFDPARLLIARPAGRLDILRTAEEALRSGAVPLVVAELEEAPDLTASRRLQLAASAGGGRGFLLLPEGRLCTNAAETRWRCAPVPGLPGEARQHWELLKNKAGKLGSWLVSAHGPATPLDPLPGRRQGGATAARTTGGRQAPPALDGAADGRRG